MSTITRDQMARRLDNIDIDDIDHQLISAKAAGLLIVYGQSDDLLEFRGIWEDEYGAYGGCDCHIDQNGILLNECDCDCPYFKRINHDNFTAINAAWNDEDEELAWVVSSDAPHSSFTYHCDGEPFGVGIVIHRDDIKKGA